jgi:acyl dehydratase
MNIKIGDSARISKAFNSDEVAYYSKVCGDNNPLHTEISYAAKTKFGSPIVQGQYVASLFGGLLGSKLPGNGTIHLGQTLKFIKPVYVNELVTACIEVLNIREDKPIITFNCKVIKSDGTIAIEGDAVVIYKGEIFN